MDIHAEIAHSAASFPFKFSLSPSLGNSYNKRKPRTSRESVDLQYRHESFLRHFDAADRLHALLSFLLLFEKLALSRYVTAVARGEHVFSHGTHVLSRDDLIADSRLDRNLEHLLRNDLLELLRELAAARRGAVGVDDG